MLIVEDNDRLRKSLLDYVRDDGFAADAAGDGEEGLYKALNWDYDLVVLDVMLPKLDGWELVQRLRQAGKEMPVIMLTARDKLDDRVKGLDRGADDYMVKPFEMDELTARIRAALRRSHGAPNPVLNIGPIQLNADSIRKGSSPGCGRETFSGMPPKSMGRHSTGRRFFRKN